MRLRLILSFALIVLVSISGVVLIARSNAANTVRAYMFRGGMVGGDNLAVALEDYYRQNGSWQGVDSFIINWNPGQGRGFGPQGMGMGHAQNNMISTRIRLADSQGSLLIDTVANTREEALSQAEIANAIPLEVDGGTVGYLLLEGGMNFTVADQSRLVGMLGRAALTAGLIAAGVAMILVILLAYGLMRPVRELTRAAEKMAAGDLSQRVPERGNDELGVLGKTFNQMAGALQKTETSRRVMTADIAHELRNPLAVQRANLEALQDGVYPLTPENLAPILEQNQLLARLVEDLRTLALADSGQLDLQRSRVDVSVLIEKLLERFRPQADQQGVSLEMEPAETALRSCMALVDAGRLEQILGNLLSNALRHTSKQGWVKLQIICQSERIQVTVRDSGPGISQEALPFIFERFYRADRSRSRAEGGSGLGLAIARQLAQAHGGALIAANHPGGGAIFTLTLPVGLEKEHET